MMYVSITQPSPSSITTTGQATVPVNVKINSIDGGYGNCQGALVLYYITGTRPDGSSIPTPGQYLSRVCAITDSSGTATVTLRNAVPGNYYINAQAECADGGLKDAPYQVMITVTSPVSIPVASYGYHLNYNGDPRQVLFDASTSSDPDGISSYSWNFGDGSSGQGAVVAHTFQNPGTYTITLTVTDRGSPAQSATFSRQIFFQNPVTIPVASFTVTPSSVQANSPVQFDASASSDPDGISSYSWNFGDGSSGQGPAVSHTYQNAGYYTATLTVTDRGSPVQSGTTTR